MKIIRDLVCIGMCLAYSTLTPMDHISMLKAAISHGLSKIFATLEVVHLCHISTEKIIWKGKIGKHPVTVVHNNVALKADERYQQLLGFNFNPVNYRTAVELWEKNRLIFEKILPHIDNAYPIEIRMCASCAWQVSEFWWPQEAYHLLKPWARELSEYMIWVDRDIASVTREESEFCLAHEVGHVMLKHSKLAAKTDKEHRIREKQADIRAVKILNSADGGIEYFKRLAYPKNPLERLERVLLDKFYVAITHPFHHERIKYLQHWKTIHERGKANH